MNKITDLRKIIVEYIAGNVDPNNEREIGRFSELLRLLDLRST